VAEIERTTLNAGKPLLESVQLFDEYRGDSVPKGQRSLAFRLIYRAGDRTLVAEEVESLHQQVREALLEKFGVTLRIWTVGRLFKELAGWKLAGWRLF